MQRSEFPGDEHYKEYLKEVAEQCSEGVQETTDEEEETEYGKCTIYHYT